ncbi:MAG: type II toxin-antitoxin system prevent-host-death family antitoxin [Ardenticatenales bacterium]|jgi:prevent-host-death family protein|nr:type II toxin-antitoxin system prevent-host-death family antitoxin [Ardenticatenales bacterium]
MITTNVTDVKARLSELLRRVAEGETVLILHRGRPIARIEPAVVGDLSADDAERVNRLAAIGLVRLPTRPADRTLLTWPLVTTVDGTSVLQAFLEDRHEDR